MPRRLETGETIFVEHHLGVNLEGFCGRILYGGTIVSAEIFFATPVHVLRCVSFLRKTSVAGARIPPALNEARKSFMLVFLMGLEMY